MKVTICIGSACHLKGSREIIEKLQKLVNENGLSEQVDLNGAFCSGNCDHGVMCDCGRRVIFIEAGGHRSVF